MLLLGQIKLMWFLTEYPQPSSSSFSQKVPVNFIVCAGFSCNTVSGLSALFQTQPMIILEGISEISKLKILFQIRMLDVSCNDGEGF